MCQFEAPADAYRFINGGKAIFTLHNEETDKRYTYRASSPREDNESVENPRPLPLWVAYLTGPENESSYSYLGTVWPNNPSVVRATAKSPLDVNVHPAKLGFEWLMRYLLADRPLPTHVKLYHAGKCGRCGRTLTTPESIKRGFGPECWGKL